MIYKTKTMDDEYDDASLQEPVPVLNPTWQEALDKVMHTSLMSKNAPQEDTEDDGLSEMEENLDVGTQKNDDDDEDDVDALSSDDEDEDDRSIEANHGRGSSRENSPRSFSESRSVSPSPSPAPRPRREKSAPAAVPAPVIHMKRDPKVEATKRRIQENLTLQKEEKYELLGRLQYLTDEKGFKPFRVLGPDDSLEDIRYEVFRANREMTKKRNVKMMQKALVTVGAGVEMLNSLYNPLNLRLDGFSKSLLLGIREYDEVLEELHWKYADSVAMPPEMKLAMTFGSSLWFYHISNHSSTPAATSPAAPVPDAPASEAPQRRMNGPRSSAASSSGMNGVGSEPVGLDMNTLMGGLGMVQSLMNAGAKF